MKYKKITCIVFVLHFIGCYCEVDEYNYVILSAEAQGSSQNFCPQSSRAYLLTSNNSDLNQFQNQSSNSKRNYEDVSSLLDSIQWQASVFTCGDNHTQSNNLNSSILNRFQNCCQSGVAYFSNEPSQVLSHYPNCNISRCEEYQIQSYFSNWILVFGFGLIGLLGNLIVIHYKIKSIWRKSNRNKEIQIYNTLVLNLSISDLLMGIYLISLAFEIRSKASRKVYFSDSSICNFLGVLNFLSSEVSLNVLAIISLFRLGSVLYPYQNQHFKIALSLIFLTWLFWIPVSILPILELEPISTFFTSGIRNDKLTATPENYISAFKIDLLLETLSQLSAENSNIRHVLQAVLELNKRDISVKSLESLGILNANTEAWYFTGYYNSKYSCSVNFLVRDLEILPQNYFTLGIVLFNVMVCFFVLIAYSLIAVNILGCHVAVHKFCCNKIKNFNNQYQHSKKPVAQRNLENQRMFFRVFLIIITDILCWVPLCVLFFVFWYEPFDQVGNPTYEYLYGNVQAVVLWIVPLNSVLNPYIYSFHLWQELLGKFRQKLNEISLSTSQ